jgi:hypothetical protein
LLVLFLHFAADRLDAPVDLSAPAGAADDRGRILVDYDALRRSLQSRHQLRRYHNWYSSMINATIFWIRHISRAVILGSCGGAMHQISFAIKIQNSNRATGLYAPHSRPGEDEAFLRPGAASK